MKYSFLIAALTTALLAAGCAGGYSIREHAIRSKIPQEFRNYTNGIIANPTDADVRQAIALGKASKDSNTLSLAYLRKAPKNLFKSNDILYYSLHIPYGKYEALARGMDPNNILIRVATPLYLIANHAREQARDYRKVDDNFVQYARKLDAVRIAIYAGNIISLQQFILLRDGVRVDPLLEIQAWAGKNPFTDKLGNAINGKISLSKFDAVFPIDELSKPGNYELVFRTSQVAYVRGDKEVRFPISFAGFR